MLSKGDKVSYTYTLMGVEVTRAGYLHNRIDDNWYAKGGGYLCDDKDKKVIILAKARPPYQSIIKGTDNNGDSFVGIAGEINVRAVYKYKTINATISWDRVRTWEVIE